MRSGVPQGPGSAMGAASLPGLQAQWECWLGAMTNIVIPAPDLATAGQ